MFHANEALNFNPDTKGFNFYACEPNFIGITLSREQFFLLALPFFLRLSVVNHTVILRICNLMTMLLHSMLIRKFSKNLNFNFIVANFLFTNMSIVTRQSLKGVAFFLVQIRCDYSDRIIGAGLIDLFDCSIFIPPTGL